MKTISSKKWMGICASALMATAVFRAAADQPATAAKSENSYTGTIISVAPNEHVLTVKEWAFFKKSFNLGENCAIVQLDNPNAAASDLRTGEKVKVSYQDVQGVLIADRVEQEPMQYEGMIKAIDPNKHSITIHDGMDRQLSIAENCKIVLRDGEAGTYADLPVGSHVTVTYETPGSTPVAREIAQTSMTFKGLLIAIDLDEKTVKAKESFTTKKFNLADNCVIVINGKTDGHLADLKINERLAINYDEINGINVANRIAPVTVPMPETNSIATPSPRTVY
jgi:hypothetical protein